MAVTTPTDRACPRCDGAPSRAYTYPDRPTMNYCGSCSYMYAAAHNTRGIRAHVDAMVADRRRRIAAARSLPRTLNTWWLWAPWQPGERCSGQLWSWARTLILDRDGHVCHVCGGVADTVDHHPIPRADGGPTIPANLRAACGPCNYRTGGQLRAARPDPDAELSANAARLVAHLDDHDVPNDWGRRSVRPVMRAHGIHARTDTIDAACRYRRAREPFAVSPSRLWYEF